VELFLHPLTSFIQHAINTGLNKFKLLGKNSEAAIMLAGISAVAFIHHKQLLDW